MRSAPRPVRRRPTEERGEGARHRFKLLEKLLGDEIRSHKQKNLTQEIRKELDKQHWRAEELGVSEEELAFLRRPSDNADNAYDD